MKPSQTKVVHGVPLRADPAREPCFKVVHLATELADYADMSEPARRQRVHKHMHNEMQNIEMTAQALADFPDAPWELRMSLARQCWDEARHTRVLHRRLRELGGEKGEFPVMNFEWAVAAMMDTIWGRLALQNRSLEGGEMDLLRHLIREWREAGDATTAELLEGILADEVEHVRYTNLAIKAHARRDPRILLEVAKAVSYHRRVIEAFQPRPGDVNAVGVDLNGFEHVEVLANVEDRRLAGFSEAEIEEILRQEEALRTDLARSRAQAG